VQWNDSGTYTCVEDGVSGLGRRHVYTVNVTGRTCCGYFFYLSGKLLTESCCTDDLMPSIPVLCLPPSRVDLKVLGLNVLIYHSQPGGSWTTRKSPPIRWWLQRGGDYTVMVLLWSWSSQVPEKPQSERLDLFTLWRLLHYYYYYCCFCCCFDTVLIAIA